MELGLGHSFGTYNFEVHHRLLENLYTPALSGVILRPIYWLMVTFERSLNQRLC
jgi:hypothetical protein